jgi:hypothetical protein
VRGKVSNAGAFSRILTGEENVWWNAIDWLQN